MADHEGQSPPILLVHGFWHGAWCWTEVAALLVNQGRRVLAVDLAGHGGRVLRTVSASARPFDHVEFSAEVSPVAGIDLAIAAALLVEQITDFASGGPVVVVAHSFGGVVLTRAAQTVPELISHMVYVTAIMPASGVPAAAYLEVPEQAGDRVAPLLVSDPAAVGALRLDTHAPGDYRKALRAAFYHDVDASPADAAIGLLSSDAPVAIAAGATDLTADAWGRIPRTFVYCSDDYANRPALQQRFIREADEAFPTNPTTVIELRSGHSPFLSQPTSLAAAINAAG